MGENGSMRRIALVATAAAAGAGMRWSVGETMGSAAGTFPWATLLVNVVGCLAIGVAAQRVDRTSDTWLAVVTGLLGGLTTFSAFAVEVEGLVDAGRPAAATAYVAASVVAGLGATALARASMPSRLSPRAGSEAPS